MKDYKLIKYLANVTGGKVSTKKDEICCVFPYSDDGKSYLPIHIVFEKKQSILEFFDMTSVYAEYGDGYSSYTEFVNKFVRDNPVFETMEYNGVLCVKSDLTKNKLENTASPALVNYSCIIIALNDMLGRKEKFVSEDQWRKYHREMLNKFVNQSRVGAYGGLAAAIAGIVLAIVVGDSGGSFVVALAVLLILGGIVAAPFFFLRGRYYRLMYKRALQGKSYK